MRLLLLAGTGEAREIASRLAKLPISAIASLAGATKTPKNLAIQTRFGGFGGQSGFQTYLDDNQITHVLDATHPFAARITDRTAQICRERALPYAQVLRPKWEPVDGDQWHFFSDEADVASAIALDQTVFLGTGPGSLAKLANLAPRRVICRRIDPPTAPFPFENGEYLLGRPPFSVADEVALFTKLGVDWLVVKNSGGEASRSKLDAARAMGIKVALIKRPSMPKALRFETPDQAIDWVKSFL